MARDYSSRPSDRSKKSKRKPAARNRKAAAPMAGAPGWVYLFCGLCLGLVVAAGVYIFARPGGSAGANIEIAGLPVITEKAVKTQAEEKPPEAAPEKEKPRFAFYEMLPNYEVVIPEEEYTQPAPKSSSQAKPAPAPSQTTTPRVETPGRYVIQAGSFSSQADADRRKAGLALLGVEAEIDRVQLEGGKTVYRVRSKPVEDVNKLNQTLKRLKNEGIDTLVMRYKG